MVRHQGSQAYVMMAPGSIDLCSVDAARAPLTHWRAFNGGTSFSFVGSSDLVPSTERVRALRGPFGPL